MRFDLHPNATVQDVERWIKKTIKLIGPGFHFDTPASEYVKSDTGERSFSDEECVSLNNGIQRAFQLLDDPYEVGWDVLMSFFDNGECDGH
ncbi:hypothetical protein [Desulfoluna butyratoxydans]|uniref:hypothetical protein n=1 Tax=Desulfoluna butyratoxydans TaxID=231438 RepID=UPI0015D1E241|nr:hypothetical protein [Desulfoluna butyratoxydans]